MTVTVVLTGTAIEFLTMAVDSVCVGDNAWNSNNVCNGEHVFGGDGDNVCVSDGVYDNDSVFDIECFNGDCFLAIVTVTVLVAVSDSICGVILVCLW